MPSRSRDEPGADLVPARHQVAETRAVTLLRSYDRQIAARRRRSYLGAALLLAMMLLAGHVGEVSPVKFFANLGNFTSYIGRLFYLDSGASVFSDPAEWFWGITQKNKWLPLLGETLLIAYVGTITGALSGFLCSFLAARNQVRSAGLRFLVRRALEFCRTVPELVFALIFVVAFHLGPLPGILALSIHTTGALGKLFAETVENIDMKPVEGLTATGAGWLHRIRFAVLPQILSNFVSYTLLRFEINVRSAGIMGFVGAGGIGQELLVSVRKFYYSDVSAILLLLVVTVMTIDLVTERLRHALLGREAAA
jgi:phosphonate transport system permease protein